MGFGTETEGSDEIDKGGSDKQIWQDDFCDGGFKNVHLEHDQDIAHTRVLVDKNWCDLGQQVKGHFQIETICICRNSSNYQPR